MNDIAEAALAVAGTQGWDALSMRSVATLVEVTPMALYRLVPTAEDLQRLAAETVGRRLTPTPTEGLLEGLRAWSVAAYSELGRYPGLASYLLANWTELPPWLDIVEHFLEQAVAVGLGGSQAVGVVNAVFTYTLGRVQLREAPSSSRPRSLKVVANQPGRYPVVKANLSEFRVARTDRHFRFGLEMLMAGVSERAAGHSLS